MLTPDTVLQSRYRIIRQLGQGGMGTVYEAIDLRFESQVALKETHFSDEVLRKQFEREARLLNRLRHPAMTRVIDHFTEGDGQYLVMDYLAGDDVWEMMRKQRGPFPPEKVLEWSDQLLDALAYLHGQNPPIIHRDIKPQNLKLSETGQIVLLDFGLAKGFTEQKSRATTSGSIFGYTPNYAPLEQIQGTGTVLASDLYSLAATLYHLLTGRIPPDALSRASAKVDDQPDPLKPADEVNPKVSTQIAAVLQKAMAQSPGKRFASAVEMRAAFRQAREIEEQLARLSTAQTVFEMPLGDSTPAHKVKEEHAAQPLSPPVDAALPAEKSSSAPDDLNNRQRVALPTIPARTPLSLDASASTLPFSAAPTSPEVKSKGRRWAILGALGVMSILVLTFIYLWRSKTSSSESGSYYGVIAPPPGQTLRYVAGTEPETLDPQVLTGHADQLISVALFDGLVEYDEQASGPRPSLARSWDINANGTVWTFHLRNDAKWSDGKPLTANDFVYSWRRVLSPELASRNAYLFYYIKNAQPYNEERAKKEDVGVRAVDDYTLEVTLERPAVYFIKLLLNPAFRPVPRQAIEKWGDKLWVKPKNIVTSGAFKLTEWTPNQRIVVERNPQFWDNARTKLEQIVFPIQSAGSADAALEMYRAGEVDALASTWIPVEKRLQLKDKKDYMSAPMFSTSYLSVNTTFAPLNDNRVRRALSMAINRQEIADQSPADRIPLTGFVPLMVGYEVAKGTDYQPDEARRLLAEAGFPGGRGFPEIELLFNETGGNRKIMETVQTMLQRELGIKATLVSQDFKSFFQSRAGLKYKGLARGSWIGDFADPASFFDLFSTPTGDSATGWYDPKYVQMLAAANAELDPDRRAALLHEVEAYLLKQQPLIPLFVSVNSFMRKPYVKNLEPNLLDQHDWREVSIDHSATK